MVLIRAEDTESLRQILCDTIVMLCNNAMNFEAELSVEGLLGITLDNRDVVLVNVKELIKHNTDGDSVSKPIQVESEKNNAGVPSKCAKKKKSQKFHSQQTYALQQKDLASAKDPLIPDMLSEVGNLVTMSAFSCVSDSEQEGLVLDIGRHRKRPVEDPDNYLEHEDLDEGPIKLKLKKIPGVYEETSTDIVTDVKEEPPDQKNTEELKNARYTVTYQVPPTTAQDIDLETDQYIEDQPTFIGENGHLGSHEYLTDDDSFLRATQACLDDSPSKLSQGGSTYRHTCPQCNYSCDKKFNMERHILRKHTKKTSTQCPMCHKFFKDRWYMQYTHLPVCHQDSEAAASSSNGQPSAAAPMAPSPGGGLQQIISSGSWDEDGVCS